MNARHATQTNLYISKFWYNELMGILSQTTEFVVFFASIIVWIVGFRHSQLFRRYIIFIIHGYGCCIYNICSTLQQASERNIHNAKCTLLWWMFHFGKASISHICGVTLLGHGTLNGGWCSQLLWLPLQQHALTQQQEWNI